MLTNLPFFLWCWYLPACCSVPSESESHAHSHFCQALPERAVAAGPQTSVPDILLCCAIVPDCGSGPWVVYPCTECPQANQHPEWEGRPCLQCTRTRQESCCSRQDKPMAWSVPPLFSTSTTSMQLLSWYVPVSHFHPHLPSLPSQKFLPWQCTLPWLAGWWILDSVSSHQRWQNGKSPVPKGRWSSLNLSTGQVKVITSITAPGWLVSLGLGRSQNWLIFSPTFPPTPPPTPTPSWLGRIRKFSFRRRHDNF